ncbi:hypothetical protein B296_00003438 [Ensete ventricosum]|uniref:poly(A)-specific ribonuclease n=1 Tax=Ensete ventricosum TaxID=4639 RepID=A0A427AZ72_ENSVE|nr:hypothetical protein B296_00003438 [Ensete ventricosum]
MAVGNAILARHSRVTPSLFSPLFKPAQLSLHFFSSLLSVSLARSLSRTLNISPDSPFLSRDSLGFDPLSAEIEGFSLARPPGVSYAAPPPQLRGRSDPWRKMSNEVENGDVEIRDVWASNLESEIYVIRNIVDDFPFIAMDTEFPGVVIHDTGDFQDLADSNYQYVRANVDGLHLLQLGLTFFNAAGRLPTSPDSGRPIVWQFNFREFDAGRDPFSARSIKFLMKTGMDFKKNQEEGVDAKLFAELFIPSGTVLDDSVYWVAFQSAFDFAYLLKILTSKPLPETREGFLEHLHEFFPVLYDIKRVIHLNDNFHGGLTSVATSLGVERVGIPHQAGSDSFVTALVFLKMRGHPFVGSMENYVGLVFGLDEETAQIFSKKS